MKPATYEFLRQRFSAYYNGEVQGALLNRVLRAAWSGADE